MYHGFYGSGILGKEIVLPLKINISFLMLVSCKCAGLENPRRLLLGTLEETVFWNSWFLKFDGWESGFTCDY